MYFSALGFFILNARKMDIELQFLPQAWDSIDPLIILLLIGVIAFLVALILMRGMAAIGRALFNRPKLIAYTTDNGSVQVNQSAITDLINSVCRKKPQLSHLKSKIRTHQKKLKIEIRLHIASGSHLKSIEAYLQKDLREALHDSLGISHVGSIDIIATGIKVAKSPKESSSASTQTAND